MFNEELILAICNGEIERIEALTRKVLESGLDAYSVASHTIVPAMDLAGLHFEEGVFFLPELILAAKAAEICFSICRSRLPEVKDNTKVTIILGTVKGDTHDMGKRIVAMMLQGLGYNVIDLGVNIPPEEFIKAVQETGATIVGLSAQLDTALKQLAVTIQGFESAGLRSALKIIIGGRLVNGTLAHKIGADGYAPNAAAAIGVVRSLIAS